MNKNLLYTFILFLLGGSVLAGCLDVEYEYDAENGFDTNTSDSSSVTVDTLQGIDASMYEQARIFPGLVDTLKEARIDTTVVFDLSKRFVDRKTLGFGSIISSSNAVELLPQPIYSTGLYAGAGELVTINVPEGNTWGLSVQIGMQTDNLDANSSYLRQPIAYTRKTLYPGKNQVRFPLGGYIWIIRELAVTGPVDLRIDFKGVYSAPDFIIDETNPAEWARKVAATTVPWLDIRGKRVAISVDRERINELLKADASFGTNLNEVLHDWDTFIEQFYNSKGLYAGNETANLRMPDFQDRFIFDVQLKDNVAMHTDNVQGVTLVKTTKFYNELLSLNVLRTASFSSIYSALQDKYQVYYVPLSNSWNQAVGFAPLYRVAEDSYYKGYTPNISNLSINIDAAFPLALKYAVADSAKHNGSDNWNKPDKTDNTYNVSLHLLPLVQLAKYGEYKGETPWQFYNEMNAKARIDREYDFEETYFFRALCDHYKENFTPFYEHWGIALKDADRDYAARYPFPGKKLWERDPLNKSEAWDGVATYDKSTFRHRINRTEWELYTTDKDYTHDGNEDTEYDNEYSYHSAANLLDGDVNSYWESYQKPEKKDKNRRDSPYELPYYIVIDMKEAQQMDGFYFANGFKVMSGFQLQATTQIGFDLYDKNVQWTTLKTVTQTSSTALFNERFIDFDTPVNTRYLRIMITDNNLYLVPNAEEFPDDWKDFNDLHKFRLQSFAEFGAYQYNKN